MTRPDFAVLGAWIFQAQKFMAAAGPCLGRTRNNDTDLPAPGTGVVRQ